MKRLIKAVDLYCGAGGSSSGLYRAAARLGLDVDLVAINHWKFAIATHSANHPHARHMETSINSVDPRAVVPGGHLDLLWASPECIHFSVARGGRPVRPQSRASGWHILHWAETLQIDSIIVENVREYRSWGPLKRVLRLNKKTGKKQRVWIPDPKRKGETYRAFLAALRSLNYVVEERILNAADYGDPTTRERLFIIARRGRRKIAWPEPTHTASTNGRLFGDRKKWRAAREVIDWNIPGQSIFTRKKPLAAATLQRILAGLEKFGGKELQPFLVILRNHGSAKSVEEPVPTLCASGNHIGVGEPFILAHRQFDEQCVDSIERPLRTITAKGGTDFALVEPFVVGAGGPARAGDPRSVERPLSTVLTRESKALVQPFLLPHQIFNLTGADSVDEPLRTVRAHPHNQSVLIEPFLVPQFGERENQKPRTHSIDAPLPVVTSHGAGALVQPCLVTVNHGNGDEGEKANGRRSRSVEQPVPALTGSPSLAVAEPFLVQLTHGGRVHDVKEPLHTITGAKRGETAIVSPLVAKYYGTGQCRPVSEPLDTITSKDRFGLVMPIVNGYALDIRFRMLQPKELAAAMGFDPDYRFEGNREAVVKQIGNAVAVNTAEALCEAVLQ